ncbi:hypothetical protein BGZ94_005618 [Podila epigama]|nr:hypothetical protein BGZ94_005618 [Podila epigama]
MVVHPRLVGVLLRGRSSWNTVAETDCLVLQHHPRQLNNPFRIITRGFPHYRVAEGESVESLQDELEYLSQMAPLAIKGKITSKKIATWLKASDILPEDVAILHQLVQDEDGYLSDLSSISHEEDIIMDGYPITDETPTRRLRRAVSLEDLALPPSIGSRHHALLVHSHSRQLEGALEHEEEEDEDGRDVLDGEEDEDEDEVIEEDDEDEEEEEEDENDDEEEDEKVEGVESKRRQELVKEQGHQGPSSSMSTPLPIPTKHTQSHYHTYLTHHQPQPRSVQYSPLLNQYPDLYHLDTLRNSHGSSHGNSKSSIINNTNSGNVTTITTKPSSHIVSLDKHVHRPQSPEDAFGSSDELVLVRESHLENDGKSPPSMFVRRSVPEPLGLSSSLSSHVGSGPTYSSEGSQCQDALSGAWGWLIKGSPLLEAVLNWVEGPGLDIPPSKKSDKDSKPNPILDIPLQFIALLTYPEPDLKAGNTLSLEMLRETSYVRQRRRTLLILTAYTLVVRYCSFDFFLVVLFASNCAMLFLMKNSGRMNVNMAKRAVNQRVGWAKHWAGGLFRRAGGNNNGNNNGSGNSHGANWPQEYVRPRPSNVEDAASIVANEQTSPRVKRRGFFGKRSTPSILASSPPNSNSTLALSIHGGEAGVAQERPATQKRRFFKRSTSNNNTNANTNTNNNANAIVTTPIVISVPGRSSTAPPTQAHVSASRTNTPLSSKSITSLTSPFSASAPSVSLPRVPSLCSRVSSSANQGPLPSSQLQTQSLPRLPTMSPQSMSPILHSSIHLRPNSTPNSNTHLTQSPVTRKSHLTASPKALSPEPTTQSLPLTQSQTLPPPVRVSTPVPSATSASIVIPTPPPSSGSSCSSSTSSGSGSTSSGTSTSTSSSGSTALAQGLSFSKSILASLTSSRQSSQQQQQQQPPPQEQESGSKTHPVALTTVSPITTAIAAMTASATTVASGAAVETMMPTKMAETATTVSNVVSAQTHSVGISTVDEDHAEVEKQHSYVCSVKYSSSPEEVRYSQEQQRGRRQVSKHDHLKAVPTPLSADAMHREA